MKTDPTLVDTGPLVALFRENDEHHKTCTDQFAALPKGLLTTWPVLTEAFFLLREEKEAVRKLIQLVEEGVLLVPDPGPDFAPWLREFFLRYSDREMQLADASLVYLAERHRIDTVFTLDRRDFAVYRRSDGRHLRILPE